jgi:hypothetical protein
VVVKTQRLKLLFLKTCSGVVETCSHLVTNVVAMGVAEWAARATNRKAEQHTLGQVESGSGGGAVHHSEQGDQKINRK